MTRIEELEQEKKLLEEILELHHRIALTKVPQYPTYPTPYQPPYVPVWGQKYYVTCGASTTGVSHD